MLDAFGVLGKDGALLVNALGLALDFVDLDLDLDNFSFANFSVFFFVLLVFSRPL